MNDPQPMPAQQNLQRVCSGPFCKLPERVIPDGWQFTEIVTNSQTSTLCYHCTTALDGKPDHLMDNNDLFSNRLQPHRHNCFEA